MRCPKCGGNMIPKRTVIDGNEFKYIYKCDKCGYEYEVVWKRKEKSMWDDMPIHKKWIRDYVAGRFRR